MSKKTAPKTKKPDPKASGERALNLRRIAMEEEALRIRRIVSKMLEPVQERLTALESRSAPAEEWVPKVGDWVVCDERHGDALSPGWSSAMDALIGVPVLVIENTRTYCVSANDWLWHHDWLRPATLQEIASHKAKEEQRAIAKRAEDERAKEMAKPIPFGTRVKVAKSTAEWVYLRASSVDESHHLLAHDDGVTMVHRSKFTIIDRTPSYP